jgi:hypothetical protein
VSGKLIIALAAASLALAPTAAQARTCAVEVEDLQQIKAGVTALLSQNVTVDRDKAKAAERQLRQALQGGGPINIDPNELKGAVRMKGTPSKAAVRDLVARIQKIVETCKL